MLSWLRERLDGEVEDDSGVPRLDIVNRNGRWRNAHESVNEATMDASRYQCIVAVDEDRKRDGVEKISPTPRKSTWRRINLPKNAARVTV